jgi:DNA-binding NtrC family response regulator
MKRPLALIVNRDPIVRALIRDAFESRGVVARGAGSGAETMDSLRSQPVRIIVVDADTPGIDIDDLLEYALRLQPPRVVIAVTGEDDQERSASLIDAGAFEIVRRPLSAEQVRLAARKATRQVALLDELREIRENLQSREGYHGVVGHSRPVERLRERLAVVAGRDRSVWFWGEAGTGKELAARTLHQQSPRAEQRFAVLSCAVLDADSWDARLGLADEEPSPGGLLEDLRGGTLYLEDPSVLGVDLQGKLLATVDLLGTPDIDVRVLAASTQEPKALAERGQLLEDLRARLAAETIETVPLRERVEDIPLLARHFVSTICAINHLPPIGIVPETLELLERHHWPDNVQGLRNAMEQAVILSPDGQIRPRDIPDRVRESAPARARATADSNRRFRDAKRDVVEAFERSYLGGLMERHGGNVTAASQQAGMLRSALQRLLRKYDLKSAEFRRRHRSTSLDESPRPRR